MLQAAGDGLAEAAHPMSSLLSGRVHGEVNDVSKGGEGPTEEGGRHVFPVHVERVPLPRGPAFRERVRPCGITDGPCVILHVSWSHLNPR